MHGCFMMLQGVILSYIYLKEHTVCVCLCLSVLNEIMPLVSTEHHERIIN